MANDDEKPENPSAFPCAKSDVNLHGLTPMVSRRPSSEYKLRLPKSRWLWVHFIPVLTRRVLRSHYKL